MRSLTIVTLALALAGSALAVTPERVVARKAATGDYAIAQAVAAVKRPATIRVRVTSTPAQASSVTWMVVCTKGTAAGTKQGQYRAATPTTRAVVLPMLKPDRCTVSANAQLARGGRVVVELRARTR